MCHTKLNSAAWDDLTGLLEQLQNTNGGGTGTPCLAPVLLCGGPVLDIVKYLAACMVDNDSGCHLLKSGNSTCMQV